MMQLARIDFLRYGAAGNQVLPYSLLFVGVLMLLLSWSEWHGLQGRIEGLDWQARSTKAKPHILTKVTPESTQEMVQVNNLVRQLDTDWDGMLQTLEHAYNRDIVLLQFTLNPQQGLQIEAAATGIAQALQFAETLKAYTGLQELYLTEESNDTGYPDFPLVFNIQAKWRVSDASPVHEARLTIKPLDLLGAQP